jgi:Fe-S-cluster-containing hydrogenase components 1
MKYYRLSAGYNNLIDALLLTGAEVIAPVLTENVSMFKRISSAGEALNPDVYINTIKSAKQHYFPVTEPIMKFSYEGKEIKINDVEVTKTEAVLVGLRPCDANAFSVLDSIFKYQYNDKFYINRRENTTVISVACNNADDACFCTSFNSGPDSTEGSDILLKKDDEGIYYAVVVTGKGESLIKKINNLGEETDSFPATEKYEKLKTEIKPPLNRPLIKEWLNNNFESGLWDEYAARCLGCASCAYLCPTCHCFDIVDEMKYDKGVRRKNWDACQFQVFTLHSSGHNPRDAQSKRYRQRVMHKFKYYSDRFDKELCTGCGRCIRACPVNLDIYDVVSSVINEQQLSLK